MADVRVQNTLDASAACGCRADTPASVPEATATTSVSLHHDSNCKLAALTMIVHRQISGNVKVVDLATIEQGPRQCPRRNLRWLAPNLTQAS